MKTKENTPATLAPLLVCFFFSSSAFITYLIAINTISAKKVKQNKEELTKLTLLVQNELNLQINSYKSLCQSIMHKKEKNESIDLLVKDFLAVNPFFHTVLIIEDQVIKEVYPINYNRHLIGSEKNFLPDKEGELNIYSDIEKQPNHHAIDFFYQPYKKTYLIASRFNLNDQVNQMISKNHYTFFNAKLFVQYTALSTYAEYSLADNELKNTFSVNNREFLLIVTYANYGKDFLFNTLSFALNLILIICTSYLFCIYYKGQLNSYQMAVSLNDCTKQLENTINTRIDFLSRVSHELRSPLNPIILLSNYLINSKSLLKNLEDKDKHSLETIKESGENLLKKIDEVLLLSKLQSNAFATKSEQTTIINIVNYLDNSLQQLAQIKKLNIKVLNKENGLNNKKIFNLKSDLYFNFTYILFDLILNYTENNILVEASLEHHSDVDTLCLNVKNEFKHTPQVKVKEILKDIVTEVSNQEEDSLEMILLKKIFEKLPAQLKINQDEESIFSLTCKINFTDKKNAKETT